MPRHSVCVAKPSSIRVVKPLNASSKPFDPCCRVSKPFDLLFTVVTQGHVHSSTHRCGIWPETIFEQSPNPSPRLWSVVKFLYVLTTRPHPLRGSGRFFGCGKIPLVCDLSSVTEAKEVSERETTNESRYVQTFSWEKNYGFILNLDFNPCPTRFHRVSASKRRVCSTSTSKHGTSMVTF